MESVNAGAQGVALQLAQLRYEAHQIVSFELVDPDGRPLPSFTAGAHIDVLLPEARVRSYSLLNDPVETHRYVIAVQRDAAGKGGSIWMHDVPRVGSLMYARPPANDFPLAEAASTSFFLAGGIGITPVLAMVRRLCALGKPWHLVYAARSARHAAFVAELRRLAQAGHGRFDLWLDDERGRPLDIPGTLAEVDAEADVYCCGPKGMIDAFLDAASGRPEARVHYERFGAAGPAATQGGYAVVLARTGQRLSVPAGKTILDVLTENDVDVQYACSSGVCGTCRTIVIEGVPDHRDDYLTEEERQRNDCIMVCCSGSRSAELVLDL
ncbi:oxidoreductase [Verticiella sediminum]|uniref:Oxidoreductase n=1 Tax=Verticiella sediminum TaxID=1247510 RepID=A0A556AJM8_9BURK|nr:PDR/VanB family oxidoreductase [Verticiella sediminum]TSH93079.1 oxidoreductase [Verticiella sediminum]